MEVLALGALAPLPGEPQGRRCQLHPREPTLGLFTCFSPPQNIRMWDMQDYECLQSFCGKHFALGHCPVTSAYFHKDDDSLTCSTYSALHEREVGPCLHPEGRGCSRVLQSHGTPRGGHIPSVLRLLCAMRTKLLDSVAWSSKLLSPGISWGTVSRPSVVTLYAAVLLTRASSRLSSKPTLRPGLA